jgi:hypothetical protein
MLCGSHIEDRKHCCRVEPFTSPAVLGLGFMLGFHHHSVETLPAVTAADARIRVLAGSSYGQTRPVHTFLPLFYLDITQPAGSSLPLPKEYPERAAYVIEGTMDCGFERAAAGRMLIFCSAYRNHTPREFGLPSCFVRRRPPGWQTPPLVELRLQLERANRTGQA